MTSHYFQLTYSIYPFLDDHEDSIKAAQKARKSLKEIADWEPLDHIETTVVGRIPLCKTKNTEKRIEAVDFIGNEIVKVLKEKEVYYYIKGYFSLMVDGLGMNIEFFL